MKKTILVMIAVVFVVSLFRSTMNPGMTTLELYRQAGEGSVEMIGEITDESVIRQYQSFYDQLSFLSNQNPEEYPEVAVYLREGSGVIHQANVWFFEHGGGYLQQVSGDRNGTELSPEEVDVLRRIFFQADD